MTYEQALEYLRRTETPEIREAFRSEGVPTSELSRVMWMYCFDITTLREDMYRSPLTHEPWKGSLREQAKEVVLLNLVEQTQQLVINRFARGPRK